MIFRKFTHYSILLLLITIIGSVNAFAQQQSTYTVQQGETLYGISKKLDVTIAELKQWNDIENNELSIGQELIYYEQEEQETLESPAEPSTSLINANSDSENDTYTVKSGDNLYSISRAHNMTLQELKNLNNLQDDNIRVGQQLTVKEISVAPSVVRFAEESSPQGTFTVYEVKRGESLNDILNKFKMSEKEFQSLNPELNLQTINRGQEVTVLLPPSRNYPNPYLQKANLQDLGEVPVSSYSSGEKGKSTTNGQLYNPNGLTAAHSNIALGSIIFVENTETGKGIYVQVNDRITGSGLKLSQKAFEVLGLHDANQPAVTIYTDN